MFSLEKKVTVITGASLPAKPDLLALPHGEFVMGETEGDKFANATERPAHCVRFSHRFWLGRFPVTVGEYRRFYPAHEPHHGGDSLPVVDVSWDEARQYCAWLSSETGNAYRLPGEAEWEYACRAGSRTPFATGCEITTHEANFLYSEEGMMIGPGCRRPVGSFSPNKFGFHDMHGNVCEWVEDAWHAGYEGAPEDGSAWSDDSTPLRVIRGGAWDYLPRLLRSAWRDSLPRSRKRDNVGFRLALTLEDA